MILTRTFWLLLACAIIMALPVGLIFGLDSALATMLVCLLLIIVWHLNHLHQLMRWLDGPLNGALPRGRGLWEIAFAGLHRRVRIRLGQQQALSETLERFRRAVQALPDGIIAFDRHRHIDWMNERAAEHFALSDETDRGQPLTNLVRHPDFIAYLDSGRYEEPMMLREGRVEGVTLQIQVIHYGDNQNLLVSRDVSRVERMEVMRRDFIANVSHELRTPLTVVAGFAQMMVDDYDAHGRDEVRHYLGLISEQTGRMQRLIEDLLTLSTLESSNGVINEERIEVGPMLCSIVSDIEAISGGRHEIVLSLESSKCISGCANEIRSAFANLAGNAVRYTPPGGRITLTWREHEGDGEYSVADTGIGIAAHHLPRLTERFYRVDRSRSRETGGTGLGLAIVKHVLTRHHATLLIESEPGVGSRFSVRFPQRQLAD